ncbi:sigma-54-dependent transcriptional regulator [Gymnodinialimonas hymeniacidonis]|uniref:sigma-54-dependent transcriptional regulator n=1 Tax=Gymnodinialimonas hymeniacidonis TaxID=3126508 RepID=UPI0034C6A2DA
MTSDAPFRALIVEDDRSMRQSVVELLEADGWRVRDVARADRAISAMDEFDADVVLSDVRMPGMSGLELLSAVQSRHPVPVVLVTAHGDIPMAVEAMQNGAYSFVEKPYEPRRLLNILRHAAEQTRMRNSNKRLRQRLAQLSGLDRILVGTSPSLRALRTSIADLAETRAPVLVTGETGTGKDLVARALHDLGPASDQPFVAINCALLSPDTFVPEMFGTEGHLNGRILQADGGTLFLDEVCACPSEVQAQFLRVLEEGAVTPEGASAPVPVSLRVISATNENVADAVASGRFREDLLYRLNTFSLELPPLRHRQEDLRPLLAHFIGQLSVVYGVTAPDVTAADLAAALAHDWPGNVRELRAVAERRVLAARQGTGSLALAIKPDLEDDARPETLRAAVAELEREMIAKSISANAGRMDDVADALGIGRRTLNEKIVKLGLDKDALL